MPFPFPQANSVMKHVVLRKIVLRNAKNAPFILANHATDCINQKMPAVNVFRNLIVRQAQHRYQQVSNLWKYVSHVEHELLSLHDRFI